MKASDRVRWDSAAEWRRIVLSNRCHLKPSHRAVLVALSYFGNRYGDRIFPSQATVAERTGACRRTVVRATEQAVQAGFLERWQVGGGQGYKRYEYALTIPGPLADEAALNPDFRSELFGKRKSRRRPTM